MAETETTRVQTVALVGSYLPRLCGIATFTNDLRSALAEQLGEGSATVVAMDDAPGRYAYPSQVRFQITADDPNHYATAAELLNINQIDAVVVQHEFGIYGGEDGSHVLHLMRRLRMPIITVLHTILKEPSPGQRAVMAEIAAISDRLVVMSRLAEKMLREIYHVPEHRIAYIPHGIPDLPFSDSTFYKDHFKLEGKRVILTFGLLSAGKGIETAIRAMPRIVEKHPEAVYVVLGATHPAVLRNDGDGYRRSLEELVQKLGMKDHVRFHNQFVSLEELVQYLSAADIYVTPYRNKAQITSGTLAYAAGAGKAVVSTPYWHAEELLGEGRGRFFPFGDDGALADTVIELLDNEVETAAMRKRAYLHCRDMTWKSVAKRYLMVMRQVMRRRRTRPRPVEQLETPTTNWTPTDPAPALNIAHLRRLTDDTGVFQHAIYCIPDRHHGYCTDDNARALVAALMVHEITGDADVLDLADRYLSFVHHAFNPGNKRFRNFMTFNREWTEDEGSEDVHGRAIWALGLTTALAPGDALLAFAARLLHEGLAPVESFTSPRAWAFTLVGVHAYLRRFSGDTHVRRIRNTLARRLFDLYLAGRADNWPWCENVVTYDNAKLPHALILSGQWIPDHAMVEQGLASLDWLARIQLGEKNNVSLIGNHGWMDRTGRRARFDQQPIEVMALIEAFAEAYRCTRNPLWLSRSRQCLGWFLGNNDTHTQLYDAHTGGCRDGLHADGPNLNEGSESTLAWLISRMTIMNLDKLEQSQEDPILQSQEAAR